MKALWQTQKKVLLADKLATGAITAVGLGTIVAVLGMMAFLIKTVLPLGTREAFENGFALDNTQPGTFVTRDELAPVYLRGTHSPLCQFELVDIESGTSHISAVWALTSDPSGTGLTLRPQKDATAVEGGLICRSTSGQDFTVLSETTWPSAQSPVAVSPTSKLKIERGTLVFERNFLSETTGILTPTDMGKLNEDKFLSKNGKIYVKTGPNAPVAELLPAWKSLDSFELNAETQEALALLKGEANVQFLPASESSRWAIVQKQGESPLAVWKVSTEKNNITGEVTLAQEKVTLPEGWKGSLETAADRLWSVSPVGISMVEVQGNQIKLRPLLHPGLKTIGASTRISSSSLFIDDGQGMCRVVDLGMIGRVLNTVDEAPADIITRAILWQEDCPAQPDVKLAASGRKRLVLRSWKNGVELWEGTTGRVSFHNTSAEIARLAHLDHQPELGTLWFSSNSAHVFASAQRGDSHFLIDLDLLAPHPEASLKSLFTNVHYEAYDAPSLSWQSTGGSDDFQPKLSLMPLIWGTLKATLFAMLFAAPLGIFAAVYSSEFLDRETRNYIKPAIELMASLPSVVLGFLAAIVIAPAIESHVVSVILIGMFMPFWLYFSGSWMARWSGKQVSARGLYASRSLLVSMILTAFGGLLLLFGVGMVVERTAFGGDLKTMLTGGEGTAGVLWGLLLSPLAIGTLWSVPSHWKARFKAWHTMTLILGPAISLGVGLLISHSGWISPSGVFGSYSQRNTIVIAIGMGFAIIPIVYSISEDALTAVPSSLRAASLACGASVWQTTARVVLPTAASGIFSALMIGLGRAVGETMIAVMATGNSPIMSANPFEGLRSLAANIAVELPEAPRDGTLYRTLFLSALVLFLFTFVINSLAEMLRARYRERNKAL